MTVALLLVLGSMAVGLLLGLSYVIVCGGRDYSGPCRMVGYIDERLKGLGLSDE